MFRRICGLAIVALNMAISVQAEEIGDLVASGNDVKKIAGNCVFTEGPAYSPKGFLLFSDIPNQRIVKVDNDGLVSDFLTESGRANGLAFDGSGNLYICHGGSRRVSRMSLPDGKPETLCESFDGKPLNGPNDLALDGHGGLYFTDPNYDRDLKIEQPCMGVYYIDASGKTTRIIEDRERPNGILVSNDHKTLYVAEPNKRELWSYEITAPGKVGTGKLIFTGDEKLDGSGPDGMALDVSGRIYATYGSVVVLKPSGQLIGRIPVPERPANCKFGGPDGKTLYVTARTSVYSLHMKVPGPSPVSSGPKTTTRVGFRGRRNVAFRGPARLTQGDKDGPAAKEIAIEDIKLKIPSTWKQQEPSNKLRLAQFLIPPAEGDKHPTELVISSFAGGGGGVDQNLTRWTGQFKNDDRKIKVSAGESPQGKYVLHDAKGTYIFTSGGPFAGGKKEDRPEHRSISIVLTVENKANYFLRLTGPQKAVDAAAKSFRESFGADETKEKPYEQ